MAARPDPIALELFKNAIFSIADEMALTVFRTTYSAVLKDNMDYSTAFADGDGRLAAQGLTLPGHLGSVPTAMEAIMRHYGHDMAPGDVFIMNDPFDGGMHLPDIFVMKPLYHEGERLAFACTVCHHTDVGGRVAGSNASDSTEIYAEGLRIAPMKLYEAGKLNKTIITFLEKNVRVPVMVLGDLRAQLAACHIAEKQFAELVARHGPAQTRQYLGEIIDYSERLTRAALRDLPDGEWSFEDWIDDDGVDVGKPIRLFVTIRKTGDRMVVDWTGTNPQVRGAINNTLSYTKSASYTGIRSVLPNNIPNNEGVFRAIEVICPPGTVGNGVLPAACAARGLTGFRMVDCMFGALAMMLPDKVKAAGDGGNSGISIGGYDAERKPFVYVEFTCGAWGARPWADGLNGNSHMFANQSCPSAEIIEAEQPVSVLRLRVRVRQGRRRQVPRRRALHARLPSQRGRGDAVRALRPQDASALRPLRRQPRPAVRELPEPAGREPAAAVQGDHADEARRRLLPRASRRRRLGRSAGARSRRRAEGRAQRVPVGRQGAGRLRRRHRHEGLDRRCGRHRAPACGHAPAPRLDRGAQGPVARPAAPAARGGVGGHGQQDHLPRRRRHRRHVHRHRAARQRRRHPHAEDLLQRRQLRARHRRGLGRRSCRRPGSPPRRWTRSATAPRSPPTPSSSTRAPRSASITTKGFRDVLEIRTLRMPRLYDIAWEKPPPLVERYLRRVVDERVDAKGHVERALDPADAAAQVDALLAEKVEAIAVCLINSFANPAHELTIKDIIQRKAPNLPVCISYEVLPEIKEYERTSTTVINAYVMPIVATYLAAMRTGLDGAGIPARLLLMQSNGGLTTNTAAVERPMNIIEFGPRRRRGRRAGAGARDEPATRSSPSTWAAPRPRPRWWSTAR